MQARYNQQMNARLYQACEQLDRSKLELDQGGFFDSILLTLNHILIVDSYWFYRCSGDKEKAGFRDLNGNIVAVTRADKALTSNMMLLSTWRQRLDQYIIDYVASLTSADLNASLKHKVAGSTQYVEYPLIKVFAHWFNHQTHHRGQVTTLLSQQSVDYGVTDLLLFDLG